MITLLDAVDENTDGDAVNIYGGPKAVFIQGTNYGGGTVTVEVSIDATVWHTAQQKDGVTDMTASANAALVMWEYPAGVQIRATLTGAGGAEEDVSAFLVGQE